MRIQQTQLQQIKLALHAAQLVFLIIGGILALVVLTKDGKTGGSVSFYFALCFLTLPALCYQILVPLWTRAWRFANVYAYAALDALFTVLWLAAFAAVSVWQNSGGDCNAKFKYGSASKCSTAQASVGFGVLVFLLFGATTAISVMALLKYRKTGILPYSTSERHGEAAVVKKDEDPWSTNTDELEAQLRPHHDSEDEEELRRAYGQPLPEEDNLLHRPSRDDPFHDAQETHSMLDTQTEHGAHPGRPMSFSSDMSITTTLPAYQEQPPPDVNVISPTGYVAPSALSPSDYAQTPGGRINFPSGNYGADFR